MSEPMSGHALLLSGGIDSAALAYWHRPALAITINYGQVAAEAEARAAAAIARYLGVEHVQWQVDCRVLGTGPMAGAAQLSAASTPEWWPFRNQLLLTLAAAGCVQRDLAEVMIGTVASDGEHGDGRPVFLEAMNTLLAVQEGRLRVSAPAAEMTSLELVRASGIPASVLTWCHSCNMGNEPCLRCRACHKQLEVLRAIGAV